MGHNFYNLPMTSISGKNYGCYLVQLDYQMAATEHIRSLAGYNRKQKESER